MRTNDFHSLSLGLVLMLAVAPFGLMGCSDDDTSGEGEGEVEGQEQEGASGEGEGEGAAEGEGEGTAEAKCDPAAQDALTDYLDDLTTHPGCTTDPSGVRTLEYTPAVIPGYTCVAQEYPFPAGVTEDQNKPIVLLIHGNSETPACWEKCIDGRAATTTCAHHEDMLAESLVSRGFRVLAVDMRYDRVCKEDGGPDSCTNNDTENLARNMDHGWGVPIAQHFIKSAMTAYPDRQFSVVGFSFGVTAARDALRRLQCVEGFNPWPRLQDIILASGANHGVSTYDLGYCAKNPSMRGSVTCEMGSRANFTVTAFLAPLNGPERSWETPCGDGQSAYGQAGVCQGHTVSYTTLVMADKEDGTYKDEFVSQGSAGLKGADNQVITLDDVDTSAYFFGMYAQDGLGLFKNHYGAVRSASALQIILAKLAD